MRLRAMVVGASAACSAVVAISSPAFAAGSDGGYGSCGANGTSIGCVAQVPGSPGDQGPGGTGSGIVDVGSVGGSSTPSPSPVSCAYAPADNGAPPPPGAGSGQWEWQVCAPTINSTPTMGGAWSLTWVSSSSAPPPPPPPPDPATVAASAESQINLPDPAIGDAPARFGIVNLPEWLWVDPASWHAVTTSATACNAGGCVTATATATPTSAVWTTGDGASVTCNGPGTPLNLAIPVSGQSTYCSHTYTETSATAGAGGFPVTVTVSWTGSWSASGAASGSGSFGPLTTTGSGSLPVEQIEAVNALP